MTKFFVYVPGDRIDATNEVAGQALELLALRSQSATQQRRIAELESALRNSRHSEARTSERARDMEIRVKAVERLLEQVRGYEKTGLSKDHIEHALMRALDPRHDSWRGPLMADHYCGCASCIDWLQRQEEKNAAQDEDLGITIEPLDD